MFSNSKTWVVWNRVVQISFKRDLPAMNAIKKKKITWYKYANINKVIRKPPIMTNMPFEKTVLCTFRWGGGDWCWKKDSPCPNSLPAPKKRAPRQHHFKLCCMHTVYLLCWNHTQLQTRKMEGRGLRQEREKSCLLTPTPTRGPRRCLFLRTSTGGAEG